MNINKKDIIVLKSWGTTDKEINQMKEAKKQLKLFLTNIKTNTYDKRITQKEAIEILGREKFLSGLHRASFHCSVCRHNGDNSIYFDDYDFFKD